MKPPHYLQDVEWQENPPPENPSSELPHATHSGVLELFGKKMRCHRLSSGETVFDADDFKNFFEGLLEPDEENPWRNHPPEKPGTYEFCCNETDFEVETVVVEERDGVLGCEMDSVWNTLDTWHNGLTEPSWRNAS